MAGSSGNMFKRTDKLKKKRHQSLFKTVVAKLHLWLGLGAGAIVLIVSITGCLFVFQKEVNDYYYRKTLFITPATTPLLPVSELKKKAEAVLGPAKHIRNITTYTAPDRAWEFMAYKGNDTALTYFGAVEYYETVVINPYTGNVTGVIDYKHNFFLIVKSLHWSLLLNTPYGQPIVGWATFIFVILLITGLIMWWPKKWNKSTREKSFKIKWKAGGKRVNYDLHNVLGFYAMMIALVIALTGMVWAFKWFQATVYVVASGSVTPPARDQQESVKQQVLLTGDPLDKSFEQARVLLKGAKRIFIYPAATENGVHRIGGYKGAETYYGADELQFDQYSAKLLGRRNDTHKNRGEKLLEMNYDIHVGAIGGLAGKILVFFAGLICASLPVTGFYVWWNKRNKPSRKPVMIRETVQPEHCK
ncbi:PepSY domain-containing protein [Chitinophaga sp. 180180018-2]|nr:PepSY domain-containing protein [Chitinophaga sp. 212800010-3]